MGFRRGIRFIAENSPQAASEVATRISNATAALGEQPYLGREGRVEDIRELVVGGMRITVVYRVRGTVVESLGSEHIRNSDSILAMLAIPKTLTVVGAGENGKVVSRQGPWGPMCRNHRCLPHSSPSLRRPFRRIIMRKGERNC